MSCLLEISPKLTPRLWHGLILGLVLFTLGCAPEDTDAVPSVLKVGVLPDEQDEILRNRYAPLITHLAGELEKEVLLVIPKDYGHLVSLFGSGEVDIAYFGGATFVTAQAKHDAVPIVMRDIDIQFSSYFLARTDDPASEIEQFRGRRISFGSELSTSGHLMPRFFLQENDITPETFFADVHYSGSHDRTVTWVRDGIVDLGAVNAEVVESMLRDGRLTVGVLKVVWETPPYADNVWAVRPGLGEAFERRLVDAFLGLSLLDEEGAEILGRIGAGGFLPARLEDFTRLRRVMAELAQFQKLTAAGAD